MKKLLELLVEIKNLLNQTRLNNKEVYSIQEFSKYADLSTDYVYKLTRSGQIKYYRPFGKVIYIKKEDAIEALLQNPVNTSQHIDQASNKKI